MANQLISTNINLSGANVNTHLAYLLNFSCRVINKECLLQNASKSVHQILRLYTSCYEKKCMYNAFELLYKITKNKLKGIL